jgi:predicted XRE-type DNA-binding protein
MSKKTKHQSARNAFQLAHILGLDAQDSVEMEFRAQLNVKIVEIVKKRRLTRSKVAKLANASRTRVTAILNGKTVGISTDLLLRILHSLGYRISEIKVGDYVTLVRARLTELRSGSLPRAVDIAA